MLEELEGITEGSLLDDEAGEKVVDAVDFADMTDASAEPFAEDASTAGEAEKGRDEELSLLKEELASLRKELRERIELDRANERMMGELAEFEEYFPQTSVSEIPPDIWEKVRRGASLSSSYALHLRKSELEKQKIGDFNKKNRRMSTGSLENGEAEKYLSRDEVKKMTPKQVKQNYDAIMESMRHWN